MQWVPTAPFEVICLQEIHFGLGKESAQWIAAGWRFLTTVDASTRFQGVALLIRESLCHAGELHFQEVVAGRLLHVRVQRPHHAIDLVGIYQHAHTQDSAKHNQRQRHILWDKLGQLLHRLPQRNLLNIMGDFNCTPSFVQGSMSTAYPEAAKYPDSDELAALLEVHQLVILNGWTRRRRQHTFVGAKHKSIIDFSLTRRHHADGLAKQARTLPDLNFSPWRLGGRHLAISSTLPLHPGWTCASCKQPTTPMLYDKLQLDHDAKVRGPGTAALRGALQAYIQNTPDPTPSQLNRFLLSKVVELFPKRVTAAEPRAWQTDPVKGAVTRMWQARAALQQVRQQRCTALRDAGLQAVLHVHQII